MKIPFMIYCRAVGLYVLLTAPVVYSPMTYLMSLRYVLIYGWLAFLLFAVLYPAIDHVENMTIKIFYLFVAVVAAVAFAFEVLCMVTFGEGMWRSLFIFFPFAAVIAGWISVCISTEKIRNTRALQTQSGLAN